MADTPASTTGTSHDFDLSSDEEDDILQNLKQQAQRGTRSSASYDPDASSNFGKTTASSEGTPNFESMRDAFREAGMEALETKSPVAAPPTVASADESIRVDFGQAAQRQSLAHQSIASVDGVMLKSRDGGDFVDAVAEEQAPAEPQQPPTDETSVSVWKSTSASGVPARPSWLGRAVRNKHHHTIEQASRRWRGGRRDERAVKF